MSEMVGEGTEGGGGREKSCSVKSNSKKLAKMGLLSKIEKVLVNWASNSVAFYIASPS
jgi:hypothetical protein